MKYFNLWFHVDVTVSPPLEFSRQNKDEKLVHVSLDDSAL